MKKIILTGGGTAGHVTPNLALLPYLTPRFEVHYIGSEGGMEKRLVTACRDVIYHEIPCVKLVRSLTPKNLLIPFRLAKSVRAAKRLLAEIQPSVVFSKGGYVALPVCLAAKNIPVVLHESDLTPGLANRLATKRCARFLTAFDSGLRNATCTGAPLRRELYRGDKAAALKICGFSGQKPVLLVTGGSLGARAINEAVTGALAELTARFDVAHLTGRGNLSGIKRSGYYEQEFADNMPDFFAAADVVLSRGGANTLFELVALGLPSVAVPLPKGNSRGDQVDNAAYFASRGAITVLPQEQLSPRALTAAITEAYGRRSELKAACSGLPHVDGTAEIAKILTRYAE